MADLEVCPTFMSSMAGANRSVPRSTVVERHLVALVWLSLLLLFVSLSLFLLVRRLSGVLVRPLPGADLIVASVAIAAIVAVLRQQVLSTRYSVLSAQF